MYTALETFLLIAILILFYITLFLIWCLAKGYTLKDLTSFNKKSKEFFNKDYKLICKENNLFPEVKRVRNLMWQLLVAKKWKLIIPMAVAFSIMFFMIDMSIVELYLYSAMFGFVFSFAGLWYGLVDYLKSPEKLVLLNCGKNDMSLRINLESQIDYTISWSFLYIGLLLNFLSFYLGIIVTILQK